MTTAFFAADRRTDFAPLFNPRSIAIIGASTDESSISGQPIRFLREHGLPGAVWPVNPKYGAVGGNRSFPDIASLPGAPDVALVAVAARRVTDALRQCGEKGVAFAAVLSSGFAEAGAEGKAAQDEVAAIAAQYGMRVVGPNCQGMMNVDQGFSLGFGVPFGLKYRLADAVARLAALAVDLRDVVAELDVNPLFVLPQGQGFRAGDALIKLIAAQGDRP